jgi:DNA/RNA-binding domain of Phe-tRNA-synthetase-like protein
MSELAKRLRSTAPAIRSDKAPLLTEAADALDAAEAALAEWLDKYDTFDEEELKRCYSEELRGRILRSRAALAKIRGK